MLDDFDVWYMISYNDGDFWGVEKCKCSMEHMGLETQ